MNATESEAPIVGTTIYSDRIIHSDVLKHRSPLIARIEDRMRLYNVPGLSMCIVERGQVLFERSYGIVQDRTQRRVMAETIFQAGSLSKTITAAAILSLSAKGIIDLDRPVGDYLKRWRVPANGTWTPRPTIRQLLNHSGGVSVHGFPGYRQNSAIPSIIDVLEGGRDASNPPVRVDSVPGLQSRYSGGGYCILQVMLEDQIGSRFEEVVRSEVFEPLGMTRSFFTNPKERQDANYAHGHQEDATPVEDGYHIYPESAAAGLWTTARDVGKFMVSIMGRGEKQGNLETFSGLTELPSGQRSSKQLGLGTFFESSGRNSRVGHRGSTYGYRSEFWIFPERHVGIALMTNSELGSFLIGEIKDTIATENSWVGSENRIPSAGKTVCWDGFYRNDQVTAVVYTRSDSVGVHFNDQDQLDFVQKAGGTFISEDVNTELVFESRENETLLFVIAHTTRHVLHRVASENGVMNKEQTR